MSRRHPDGVTGGHPSSGDDRVMADVLVVAVFDDERAAWDAVVRAAEVAAQGEKGIHDACLVVRAPDGTVHMRDTADISPTKAGWYGGAWGLVGGVILGFPIAIAAAGAGVSVFVARRRDLGVTHEFERAVADRLEPGRSAAVVLVDAELAPRVEAAAGARGAWTSTVTLADAQAITPSG
jgi:uncharacterized membrane protein